MRSFLTAITALVLFASGAAQAKVAITVDKDNQQMTVAVDGVETYRWPVSSGLPSYETPNGSFRAFRMEEDHYSKEFDEAPMPHSIFFTKIGHAIHGSYDTKKLGMPASHGCVRISPAHAATLFALVKQDGLVNTKVVLTGSEQVALAQRGVRVPRLQPPLDLSAGNERETAPQYADPGASYPQLDDTQRLYSNRNAEFRPQDYAQPSYVNPNYGFVPQPQYIRPGF